MPKTLVMIPTYNESQNVKIMYERVRAALPHTEILFVDDNSPDGTGSILDQLANLDTLVHVLHRSGKLGIGSAHLAGIEWAYENNVHTLVTMDADCTHSPEEVLTFIDASTTSTVVVGSRFIGGVGIKEWPFHRQMITRTSHLMTQLILGMVSGDRGDGFSAIANSVSNRSEHRLILNDQPICQFAGHIGRGDDRCDSIDCIRTRNVNRNNASVRMRTSQSCAPQHVVGPHVTRESEATLNFGDTIWSARTCT